MVVGLYKADTKGKDKPYYISRPGWLFRIELSTFSDYNIICLQDDNQNQNL